MKDYSENLQPVDGDLPRRRISRTTEDRIREELDKVRKLGARVEGRDIFVPFHLSGLNPLQFLSRNGFIVRYI